MNCILALTLRITQQGILISRMHHPLRRYAFTQWIKIKRTQKASTFLRHQGIIDALGSDEPPQCTLSRGLPVMTWDPYRTLPEVTQTARQ